MSDDLGRGQLDWQADRWQALDKLATDSVGEHAVLRHLVGQNDDPGAFSARIAGKNIDVGTIKKDFIIDMLNDDDKDVERKLRVAAQGLAVDEDGEVLNAMDLSNPNQANTLTYKEFIRAKNDLTKKGAVQSGFGVAVGTDALTDLEGDVFGVQSGLDAIERALGTKVLQSNALGAGTPVEAVIVRATPPAYQMVRAWGPRLRVLNVTDGKKVELRLEEGIAVGELDKDSCLAIERKPRGAGKVP